MLRLHANTCYENEGYRLVVSTRETERYLALIDQLLREEGGDESRGSTARVARRLGVSGPFISMVRKGDRGVGREALTKAMDTMGLRAAFFHDPQLGPAPDYREHLRSSPESSSAAVEPAFWDEFLRRYDHVGELSAEELQAMKRFAGRTHRISSWYDWVQLAEWLRNRQPSATFDGLDD